MSRFLCVLFILITPLLAPGESAPPLAQVNHSLITETDLHFYAIERRLLDGDLKGEATLSREALLIEAIEEHALADWAELKLEPPDEKQIGEVLTRTMETYERLAGSARNLSVYLEEEAGGRTGFSNWLREATRRRMLSEAALMRYLSAGPEPLAPKSVREADYIDLARLVVDNYPEDSLEKALQVRRDVAAGLSFEGAARLYGTEESAALGFLQREELSEKVLARIADLTPGQISEPVETGSVYSIFKVLRLETEAQRRYWEKLDRARSELMRQIARESELRVRDGWRLPDYLAAGAPR